MGRGGCEFRRIRLTVQVWFAATDREIMMGWREILQKTQPPFTKQPEARIPSPRAT